MNRTILAMWFSTLTVFAAEPSLESRFDRERPTLSRFEGATSEPSCSGTNLAVYLRGDVVWHLDWTMETSTQLIRRQYYFDGGSPRLVIETIKATLDSNAERLEKPRLVSTNRYRLDSPQSNARQTELLHHAKFLVEDFKKHRSEFNP
jgi:hypothetical protein